MSNSPQLKWRYFPEWCGWWLCESVSPLIDRRVHGPYHAATQEEAQRMRSADIEAAEKRGIM